MAKAVNTVGIGALQELCPTFELAAVNSSAGYC